MQKNLLYLFGTIASILLIMPIISVQATGSTNSTNNTSYVYNGPTYNSEKNNLHNFLMAKRMEENATKFELANSDKFKEFYHQFLITNPLPDLNYSTNWAKEKIQLAKLESGYTLWNHKTNYDIDVQYEKADILKQLHDYLQGGRNGIPAFTNCEAFHNCTTKPFIPVVTEKQQHEVFANSTLGNFTIPLKPEFLNNPSGYIESPTYITNMTELQKYMTNSTKTNSTK